jgi:hypothetical protein
MSKTTEINAREKRLLTALQDIVVMAACSDYTRKDILNLALKTINQENKK